MVQASVTPHHSLVVMCKQSNPLTEIWNVENCYMWQARETLIIPYRTENVTITDTIYGTDFHPFD